MHHQSPLPEYLRLNAIVTCLGSKDQGKERAVRPRAGLLPIGRSAFLAGVKAGRFPQPVKLSPRVTAWRADELRKVLEELERT